jgi:hypothetical protein
MPLARYFVFVGGVLLALLFASNAFLPKPPVEDRTDAAVEMPVIRIQSDRKWPERVVFDTSIPTITPAPLAKTVASVQAPATAADVSAKVRVREAFAQLPPPSDPKQLQASDSRKQPESKPQRKRRIARSRVGPPGMLFAQRPWGIQVAQQPRFGFFANSAWNSTW